MAGGTRHGFSDYVSTRAAVLRRTAYLLCGDWHQADDLTQTALAKLYVAWPRASRADSLDAYARQVLTRAFLDQRRRWWWREVPTADLPDLGESDDDTEDRVVLLRALAQVPPRQRAVLVLRYWEDMAVAEVAEALGCSSGTVKSQAARGLAALRAELARNGFIPTEVGERS